MNRDIKDKLQAPFHEKDIEWRLQRCGKKNNGEFWGIALAYITNRAIMNRLDDVFGPFGWKNVFEKSPNGAVLCGISVLHNGEWITKYDGADDTEMEAIKGGLSGAMKRAAVQWGIGRYLYNLEANFANITPNGKLVGKTKSKETFKWDPPKLPKWALPTVNDKTETEKPVKKMSKKDREKAEKMMQDEIEKNKLRKEVTKFAKTATDAQKYSMKQIADGVDRDHLSLEQWEKMRNIFTLSADMEEEK